jgi:uncharacterized protein
MKKIELEIMSLTHGVAPSHNYAVVLDEIEGSRRLPIVIGSFEAQAIALAMERMAPPRPMTHDLFKNTLESFHIELKEIIISNLVEGIFYAKLVCQQNGELVEVDTRTSDAIAMAVRFGCPIYTFEFILEAAGIEMEATEKPEKKASKKSSKGVFDFERFSVEELNVMLDDVLASENYERAAKIRDEIQRRQEKKKKGN